MAQTGFTPIQLYSSSTPTNAPSVGNLTNDTKGSELAINIADKNLFFKDSTNAVNTVPIRQSGTSSNGWLSSIDWNTFNNKQPAGTYVTNVTGTAPVVSSGGTTPAISMAAATTSVSGYLTSTDWNTFNNKQPAGSYAVTNAAQTFSGIQTFTSVLSNSTGPVTVSTTQGGLKSFCPGFAGQFGGIFFSTPSASVDQIEADIFTSGNTGVPSSKLKVLKDGDVNVLLGNLVIGTSGKGIDFSATAGTGTSELLNDYEEGTWTPTQGSGLTVVGTFSSSGAYTKVGRLVNVTGTVNGSTSVAVSGIAQICAGLPFTVGTTGVGAVGGSPSSATSACFSSGTSIFSYAGVAATTTIAFSVTYFV